jgi:hypothetical protein
LILQRRHSFLLFKPDPLAVVPGLTLSNSAGNCSLPNVDGIGIAVQHHSETLQVGNARMAQCGSTRVLRVSQSA